jgi:hypothetical protein
VAYSAALFSLPLVNLALIVLDPWSRGAASAFGLFW